MNVREMIGIHGHSKVPHYRLPLVAKGHILTDGFMSACGKKTEYRMTRSNWTGPICKACEKRANA